jgi:hypothetical protein
VAACHDVDQGSSLHAVNYKKNHSLLPNVAL